MNKITKRLFDLLVSVIVGLVFFPVMLFVSIAILISMGSPIFFTHERPGFKGRPFKMYKFRTMRNLTTADGQLLSDKDRLTPLGRFLRSTSLDELPGLINVLKGEMSIVGPRPLEMYYLDRYSPEQARRHDVRPGITGWAQVNGRNLISWEEKFKMDVWYVDNHNFWLDLKILVLTLKVVITREGVIPEGSSVVQDFMGSRKEAENDKNTVTLG